jgi:hypothetical protein
MTHLGIANNTILRVLQFDVNIIELALHFVTSLHNSFMVYDGVLTPLLLDTPFDPLLDVICDS